MPALRTTRRVLVVVASQALVAGIGPAAWWLGRRLPRPADGPGEPPIPPAVGLATLYLATPVELTVAGETVWVSRFVLDRDRGLLTLERDELEFNDYGDATRTGGPRPLALRVDLRWKERNRWEVAPATPVHPRLRFVEPADLGNPPRLILFERRGDHDYPRRILDLRDPNVVPDQLRDRPVPDRFSFTGLEPRPSRGRGLYLIKLSGSPAAGGRLEHDPNHIHFHPDGSVGGSTLMAGRPVPIAFRPLGPDPAGRGRRAFELVVGDAAGKGPPAPHAHILVLGPTDRSEHRLVVKSGGQVMDTLSLRSWDR